jgi:hypothetical protein
MAVTTRLVVQAGRDWFKPLAFIPVEPENLYVHFQESISINKNN